MRFFFTPPPPQKKIISKNVGNCIKREENIFIFDLGADKKSEQGNGGDIG